MDYQHSMQSSGKKSTKALQLQRLLKDNLTDYFIPESSTKKQARTPLAVSNMQPKRVCELDISHDYIQPGTSGKKTLKSGGLGAKVLPEAKRNDELMKLFGMEPSPLKPKFRKQLWSTQKSSSKKAKAQVKVTANKENVRKTIFTKPSHRRTSELKTNPADQTLPLIDMEDLERNPNKLKQSLRIPQLTINKPPSRISTKRQTIHQTKVVKPVLLFNSTKCATENKNAKRQTVHQSSKLALKAIPEINVTDYNEEKTAPKTLYVTELKPIYDILKEVVCRMDKLELRMNGKFRCEKCAVTISPEKEEKPTANSTENVETNTVNKNEMKKTILENTEKVPEENKLVIESDKIYLNQTVLPELISSNIEQIPNLTVKTKIPESHLKIKETELPSEIFTEPTPLMAEDQDDIHFTIVNVNSIKKKRKSRFELLEAELQNSSITSLPFFDSDDCESPMLTEINFDYLLGGKNLTEIVAPQENRTHERHESTDSNDAIRKYNEMRKCIPLLCTPKISRTRNACLMTPSVQNSHKKLLSRRIQEQLSKLNE